MDSEKGRISLRLDADDLQALDELVGRAGYETRSEALRDAIETLLGEDEEGLNHRRVTISVPLVLLERIDALVDIGELLDDKSGMLEVLRKGVEGLENDALTRADRMERHRTKVLSSRKERRKARDGLGP
jgi:metal-responsive CopG/Arc/MetJ family transcriptional regulator